MRSARSIMPRGSRNDAHIVVTEPDGTETRLLVGTGPGARIRKNPITGLGQVVTTGDNAERVDQRTPQMIVTDQPDGMGQFWYTETEGVTTFTDSECDTRYPGMIVLPPAATQLGSAIAAFNATSWPAHIEVPAATNAKLFLWMLYVGVFGQSSALAAYRFDGASTWTALAAGGTGITQVRGYTRFRGYYIFATALTNGLFYSTNATAWTQSGYAKATTGICVHDDKVFIYNVTDARLEWHTDPTATSGWATATTFYPLPGEEVVQLVEWQRGGRTAVFLVTTRRTLWYDEDADTYHLLVNYTDHLREGGFPWAHAWLPTGDLFISFFHPQDQSINDTCLVFSGTQGTSGPNKLGGLPTASRVALTHTTGGMHWLYAWGAQRYNTTNAGRTLARNQEGGWHTLLLGTSGVAPVIGGGYGRGLLWTIMADGKVYEQVVPDLPDLPLLAASGERTYPTSGSYNHEYAFTDGGTTNMDKQWRWVAVKCLDHTSANKVPGLAANTSVVVQYRLDTDTAWTTLGTLTSANTAWPVVLPISSGNGVKGKQFKIRLQLASTTANNTPVVASVAVAYTRSEVPRYAYTVPLNLADRTHALYAGKSIAQLQAALDRWTLPGATVKLQFAGGNMASAPSTSTTIQNCLFAYSGVDDPEQGPDQYQGIFSDFTPPASG